MLKLKKIQRKLEVSKLLTISSASEDAEAMIDMLGNLIKKLRSGELREKGLLDIPGGRLTYEYEELP